MINFSQQPPFRHPNVSKSNSAFSSNLNNLLNQLSTDMMVLFWDCGWSGGLFIFLSHFFVFLDESFKTPIDKHQSLNQINYLRTWDKHGLDVTMKINSVYNIPVSVID